MNTVLEKEKLTGARESFSQQTFSQSLLPEKNRVNLLLVTRWQEALKLTENKALLKTLPMRTTGKEN